MSDPTELFTCTKEGCGHEGPVEDFYIVRGRRRSWCKECDKKVASAWRAQQVFRPINMKRWLRIQDLAVRVVERLKAGDAEDKALAKDLERAFLKRDIAAARARRAAS